MTMRYSDLGGCGDTNDENLYRQDEKQSYGSSRYISQFANKVRQDANQCKTACWSSMGIPATELDSPNCYLRKFSRQLPSHVSLQDFLRERGNSCNSSRLNLNSNSVHQTFPLRNIPSKMSNSYYNNRNCQKLQQSRNKQRVVPLLVRNRKANFRDADFSLPPIKGVSSNTSNGSIDKIRQKQLIEVNEDDKSNDQTKLIYSNDNFGNQNNSQEGKDQKRSLSVKDLSLLELACATTNIGQNETQDLSTNKSSSVNLKDAIYGRNGVIDKRNTRCSVPHLLNPSLNPPLDNLTTSRQQQEQKDIISRLDALNQIEREAGNNFNSVDPTTNNNRQVTLNLCDAFILQKLLELRGLVPPTNNNSQSPVNRLASDSLERGDNLDNFEINNLERGNEWQSDCYNGKISYIERGEKDFIRENAIKCAQMPAKIPQRKVVDDWHGNGQPVNTQRMVFKQNYGQVPEYIKRRKAELEDEQETLCQETEQCRQLTDHERKQIIDGLRRNWEDLVAEFQKLPLFSSSPRVIKKKAEIETQLHELHETIRRTLNLYVSPDSLMYRDKINELLMNTSVF